MTITNEKDINKETLLDVAKKMIIAARTAPKARGRDFISIALTDGVEIKSIADRMKEIDKEFNLPSFSRDAENILASPVLVLIGTSIETAGLTKCGMCGFESCDKKKEYKDVPCVFNSGDLGIAIGSAVSIAMNYRVDNRIMYTAGQAVLDLVLLGEDVKIAYVIPLSATSKSPYFDRNK